MEPAVILVVEDDDDIADAMKDALELGGFQTLCARNGVEALEQLRARQIGLVLLDWSMPTMGGAALLERIRLESAWDGIPVVVVSASHHVAAELSSSRVAAFLGKPMELDALLEIARRYTA